MIQHEKQLGIDELIKRQIAYFILSIIPLDKHLITCTHPSQ